MIKIPGIIATVLLTTLVAWMGCDLFYRGASGLHAGYLFETPRNLGRSGGIGPMLANTGVIVGLATLLAALVSLPLAVAYTEDRKSTRLHSSHLVVSYAVFCLKKLVPR